MSSGGMGRAAGAEQAPLLLGRMDGAFDSLPPGPGTNPAALGLGGGFGMGGMPPRVGVPMGGLAGGARGPLGGPLGGPRGGPLGGLLGRPGGGPGPEARHSPFPGAQCLAALPRCSALCACVGAPCPETSSWELRVPSALPGYRVLGLQFLGDGRDVAPQLADSHPLLAHLGPVPPRMFLLGLLEQSSFRSCSSFSCCCPGVGAFSMGPRPMGSGAMAGNGAHAGGAGGGGGNLAFGFKGFAGVQPVLDSSGQGVGSTAVLLPLAPPTIEPPRCLEALSEVVAQNTVA